MLKKGTKELLQRTWRSLGTACKIHFFNVSKGGQGLLYLQMSLAR